MPIVTSTIYWFLIHGTLNFILIPKYQFDYIKRPFITAGYFFLATILFLLTFINYFQQNIENLLFSSIFISVIIYALYIKDNKQGFWQLILSKGADVTLQQVILLIIFNELTRLHLSQPTILTFTFFALHIPLFFLKTVSKMAKIIFFVAIVLGGLFFAYSYLNFPNQSLVINQISHISFYIIYWLFFRKHSNMGVVTFTSKNN